ncbi:hypothetical protein LEP1GSC192_3236 [Leptospira sp. B5-022]|nr:hypothetical protein LEP1GSC192_3236 [Leptospira sp. B5-022]
MLAWIGDLLEVLHEWKAAPTLVRVVEEGPAGEAIAFYHSFAFSSMTISLKIL